jgi:hypothetical protein
MESKKKYNTKQTILYFDTFSWNVCKIKEIYTVDSRCLELGWLEFLSKSRTSLCINIYNLTPVESNSCWVEFGWVEISVVSNKSFGPRDVENHIIYIR